MMTVDRWVREAEGTFDIMFLDPPYADENIEDTLVGIYHGGLLDPDGLLVLEHAARSTPPQPDGCLALTRTQKYGDSSLSFYEWPAGSTD